MKVIQCKGEGQGSCKRCSDNGKRNRTWMCFLYRIEGYDGCYCQECVKEIEKNITDKQIEEMARSVCHNPNCKMIDCETLKEQSNQPCDNRCRAYIYAKRFYDKGYRKASDLAEEIFTEIETYLFYHEELPTIYKTIDKHIFDSIKKKYIPSCSTCKHITGCERCRAGKPCESYESEIKNGT